MHALIVGMLVSAATTNPPQAITASPAATKPAPPPASPASQPAPAATAALPAAESELGLLVTARVGAMVPTSKLRPTLAAGAELGYRLSAVQSWIQLVLPAQLLPLLLATLELDYAQPAANRTESSPAVGGSYHIHLVQRTFAAHFGALASVRYGQISPYAGLAWGINYLNAKTGSLGVTTAASQWRSGLELRGGAGYRVGPGDVVGELRYRYVGLRFRSTGDSNAGGFTLSGGYRLAF